MTHRPWPELFDHAEPHPPITQAELARAEAELFAPLSAVEQASLGVACAWPAAVPSPRLPDSYRRFLG